jgi:hypothetical protein
LIETIAKWIQMHWPKEIRGRNKLNLIHVRGGIREEEEEE